MSNNDEKTDGLLQRFTIILQQTKKRLAAINLLTLYLYGADGGTRTLTSYAHHPLKMACLPIPPHPLF